MNTVTLLIFIYFIFAGLVAYFWWNVPDSNMEDNYRKAFRAFTPLVSLLWAVSVPVVLCVLFVVMHRIKKYE